MLFSSCSSQFSLQNSTLKCFRFILEHSGVPIVTLFESSKYICTEDFLAIDVFGQGHYGTGFALTDLAVDIIKVSECEPAGNRENIYFWLDLWLEAERYGLPPTADEPMAWANRILSLGLSFVPFSWPLSDQEGFISDDLDYHRWLLELCLSNGGNPNSELGFTNEYVPLEFALDMAADMRRRDPHGYHCYDLARSLLTPLIKAGANIYRIREVGGELRSVTDLAFSSDLDCPWKIALSDCGFNFDAVIEEDQRNLRLYQCGNTAVVTGIDVKSIKPERNGLRRRN